MFPLQSDDHHELVFEDPSFFEQANILEDMLADHAASDRNDVISKGTKRRQRTHSPAGRERASESKKVMHRDVERQRRQEMTALYASLRSLLPPEYIKGKRSVSDHMHEAVNYITYMQGNVKELEMRRDSLNKLSNLSARPHSTFVNISSWSGSVIVRPCQDGLEILISSGNEESFPLSRVLVELLQRGLNVVSCDSTRVNEKFLHKIQIEASDQTSIDLSELQDRLTFVINVC